MASPTAERATHGAWALRLAALGLTLLGLVPTANLVTTGAGLAWWPFAVQQWLLWTGGLLGAVLLLSWRFSTAAEQVIGYGVRLLLRPSNNMFRAMAGTITCALALVAGWRLFGWQAAVGDEFAQNWQGHLLTSGRLFARAEPNTEFFSTIETLVVDGRWFAQFPMGWPVIRALGALMHAPWLLNPLLAGIGCMATYQFVQATRDELSARSTAILFALSPFVVFMAGSQMNHVATLVGLWVALAALAQWDASTTAAQAWRSAALMGASFGIAATIRPYDAAIVAAAVGIFQLRSVLARQWLARSLVVQCAVGAIPVLLLLAANGATTGHAFAFGYDVLNGPEHRPGFHMTPFGIEHTPRRALYIVSAYLMKLDLGLLAWPVPAVLPVVVTLCLQRRASQWDNLLVGVLFALLGGYAYYWSESYFVGPRFLIVTAPIFLLFTARMPVAIRERLRVPAARATAALMIPAWLMVAWTIPPSKSRVFGVWQAARSSEMRLGTGAAVAAAVQHHGDDRALVFIAEGMHARLAARLRALGMRPLIAEQVVLRADACMLQQTLDDAERLPATVPTDERARLLSMRIEGDAAASPLTGRSPADRLALVTGRAISSACAAELSQTNPGLLSLAEMLPFAEFGRDGRLGGGIVYARDFGRRNEVLRARFGDMPWYVARVFTERSGISVVLEPYH